MDITACRIDSEKEAEKRGIRGNSMGAYDSTEKKSGCLRPLLIAGAVLAVIFFMVMKTMVPVSWRHFNDRRIAEIEQEYAISLDNAVPKRYWVPAIAQDTKDCFTFYTEDPEAFMASFRGEEILKRPASPQEGYYYQCRVRDNFFINAEFTLCDSKKGKYLGSIVSYTDNSYTPKSE